MRKLYTFGLSILLLSCLSETSVEPGSSATFIRYFNGGNNDEAKALELAPDGGFMILATTRIQKAEADIPRTKIKVVKTDAAGNPLWQKLYPDFANTDRDYLASSIAVTPDGGYIIIGDVTIIDSVSQTLVMKIDADGNEVNSLNISFSAGVPERGKGIVVDPVTGGYVALSTQGTDKMIISQITASPFAVVSPQQVHQSGETTLASRMLVDEVGKVVISGRRTLNGLTGIRLIRTLPESPATEFDIFANEPGFVLAGFDICNYGSGYAVAGASNIKPGGVAGTDTDMMLFIFDHAGNKTQFHSLPFDDPNTPENEDNQIDAGNAITATSDGGLVFFATINSAAIDGRGDTEFYLKKIDAFGTLVWSRALGSRFKDEAVAIRQLPDRSLIALGTTTQGSLKILTLFKTNKDGLID